MKRFYAWTRDLHLYLGLFGCPFILLFAVSTLVLNHPAPAPQAASSSTPRKQAVPIVVPEDMGTFEQAKKIMRQLNLTGEIEFVRHQAREERLVIPVMKPGQFTRIEVDLRAKTATVESQEQGLAAALIYLHKMPGPHLVKFRGNWIFMAWWKVLTDAVVYVVLFLTVSGLYLWWMLKAERKVGWVLLAAGVVSAVTLVAALGGS